MKAEAVTDRTQRRFAVSEATTAWQGLYHSLDAFWVNDPVRDAAAHHKPWQLAVAQNVGLTIPETLMTNDPEQAREFWHRHEGCVIFELPETWRETRRLQPEHHAFAEAVRVTRLSSSTSSRRRMSE